MIASLVCFVKPGRPQARSETQWEKVFGDCSQDISTMSFRIVGAAGAQETRLWRRQIEWFWRKAGKWWNFGGKRCEGAERRMRSGCDCLRFALAWLFDLYLQHEAQGHGSQHFWLGPMGRRDNWNRGDEAELVSARSRAIELDVGRWCVLAGAILRWWIVNSFRRPL